MPKFKYTIEFNAEDQPTSVKVMESLVRLTKHVKPNDLEFLSKKIEQNPKLIDQAKTFL